MMFLLLLYLNINSAISLKFDNVTSELFPYNSGILAAFGHMNADEFTDIITLQQGGKEFKVFLGAEIGESYLPQNNCSLDSIITSVVPGDFNGDSYTDLLVTLIDQDNDKTTVQILWSYNNGSIDCKAGTEFKIASQPVIVDFDGDMIPDIIGEVKSEGTLKRYVWISSTNKTFTKYSLQESLNQNIRVPHSSGLIDLNNDLVTDMLITGNNYIEEWMNNGKNFSKTGSISYPGKVAKYFQSTFADLTLDGKIDHLLPVCYDKDCMSPAILLWNPNSSQWEVLLDNFRHKEENWTFKLPKGTNPEISAYLPVTLRTGDVDMDGYPDFLLLLQSKTEVQPVIIKNVPCSNCTRCGFERCLEIMWDVPGLSSVKNAEIAVFFDIYEDGILDILISSKEGNDWKIYALKNTEVLDSCFMKVLVLSGLCRNCTYEHIPGVNLPGPIVQYNMTKSDGHPHVTSAVQLSQTAFFSLHLPYSIFGLGETPNFIDALTVSVPAHFEKNVHKRKWTQIIPNSQIVVIPNPPDDESKWVKKLYVTPSQNVLFTCLALIGTCIFVAFIIVFLHWRERKEDKKEKMQDAYRFHFDAM